MSGTLTPQYLKFIDGSGNDGGNSITTGPDGSVYVTGYASTTGFSPAGPFTFADVVFQKPATFFETIYIGKIGPNGVPVWLRTLDGITLDDGAITNDRGQSISVDSAGNVHVTGFTNCTGPIGTIAFRLGTCNDAGPAPAPVDYLKPATSNKAIVLLKLDTNGNFGWLKTLDGTGNEEGLSISTNGIDVYFTGYTTTTGTPLVYGTCGQTFPFPTTQNWTKPTTYGQSAIIGKISGLTGNLLWLKLLNGGTPINNTSERGNGIAIENSGDVLITGGMSTTATSINFITCIGPSTPATPIIALTKVPTTGNSLFVLKLDSGGGFVWMRILDSALSDGGDAVTIRYEVPIKVYIAGSTKAENTIVYSKVYDPANPPPPLISQTWNVPMTTATASALSARIDFSSGDLDWLSFLCSSSANRSTGIAVSPNFTQDVYVSGIRALSGTSVQFGKASLGTPPPLITIPTPTTGPDGGYILKLDTSGNYGEFKLIYGTNNYRINGITVDIFNDIYIIGDTNTTNAGIVFFADQTFTKPATLADSAFVGKLKNVPLFPPINPICYAKGTLILTDRGYVPIEDIKLSDKVCTFDRIEEKTVRPVHGVPFKALLRVLDTRSFANIKFIGHFSTDATSEHTAPICITAGALGENQPERDLFVSPNHSINIGNRMVFAKDMVNEISIYQDMSFETIEYYHILSDDHYIINANGVFSETLGTEELKLFESMIYAQSKLYEPLALETKYHLQDIAT